LGNITVSAADRPLKLGMRGTDVQIIQMQLANAGFYNGTIDGIFGNLTLKAVEEFQRSVGITVDGVAGEVTRMYLERAASTPSRYSRVLTMVATAYTSEDPGNTEFTYRGNRLHKGLVAVDPTVIPLGTRLYIPGYGYAIADDIGGAIKGNRIDLAYEDRGEALKFGRRQVTVYVLD